MGVPSQSYHQHMIMITQLVSPFPDISPAPSCQLPVSRVTWCLDMLNYPILKDPHIHIMYNMWRTQDCV